MAYWGGGGAGGWSQGQGPAQRGGRSDGWDYDELGKIYDVDLPVSYTHLTLPTIYSV